jgi:Ca2+-binding RTX toxin-like protein
MKFKNGVRILATAVLVTGAVFSAAPEASATPQCAYDSAARTLAVTLSSTDFTTVVQANGPYLEVGSVFCALLTEVNTVTINAAAIGSNDLYFGLRNGPLGPGNFNEGNGSSEIEFTVNGLTPQSTLWVTGTDNADKITLGWYLNRTTGASAGQINLNAFADGATVDNDISFPQLPGDIIVITGQGDDVISGAGTGTFFTGQIYVPLSLAGEDGSNQVTGGGGNDILSFTEAKVPEGGDMLMGGAGTDTVRALNSGSVPRASISIDGIANDGSLCPGTQCNGDNVATDIEAVEGSTVNETISGNDAAQSLAGGGGDDLVQGLGGDDTLTCTSGTYEGGGGNDTIAKWGYPTAAECGILRGGSGVDTVDFRSSDDPVVVTLDNLSNDGPVGATTNVRTDVERVIGSGLSDTLTGNGDSDELLGAAGSDTLQGGDGPDTLVPGPGADIVRGGHGVDRISYDTSLAAIVVDAVAKSVTGEGTDTYTSIESYVGSAFADVMDGSALAERMVGGPGNDDLAGAGGNDTLIGGAGDDTIDGGPGTDTCTQGTGVGSVVNCE